jgi:hypothetical protein
VNWRFPGSMQHAQPPTFSKSSTFHSLSFAD